VRLSAAKRGQLILLIVAVSSGAAGYCVGRYQSFSAKKIAFGMGDGFTKPVVDNSMGSSRARELYGQKKFAAAYAEATRVLALNPSDAGAYAVMKLSQSRLGISQPLSMARLAPKAPAPKPADKSKRSAQRHWNNGIIYFQAGKYDKARDEWLLCKQLEPSNLDCQTGLQRLDSTYGNGS